VRRIVKKNVALLYCVCLIIPILFYPLQVSAQSFINSDFCKLNEAHVLQNSDGDTCLFSLSEDIAKSILTIRNKDEENDANINIQYPVNFICEYFALRIVPNDKKDINCIRQNISNASILTRFTIINRSTAVEVTMNTLDPEDKPPEDKPPEDKPPEDKPPEDKPPEDKPPEDT